MIRRAGPELAWALALCALLAATQRVCARQGADEPTAPPETTTAEPDRADASLRRLFGELTSVLGDALDRLDREAALPESTWNPFEETKASNDRRLNDLLDECAALLAAGAPSDVRAQIRALETERKALEDRMRVALESMATARPKSERDWYELLGKSREDWEAAASAAVKRRNEIDAEIARLRGQFAEDLRGVGLELGSDGADALLTTVAGDRFVDMAVAFDNVRTVTEQLRRITERMGESPDTAKRYYGMYVLLVRTLDRIQDAFVEHLERVAIPQVEAYGAEAAETQKQAAALLRGADDAARVTLEKNIDACRLAQEASGNYASYLRTQAGRVRDANRTVEERLKVAENTYRTMAVSVSVAELIRRGETDLSAVLSLDLPPLKGFDNAALREQYEKLNQRLNAGR